MDITLEQVRLELSMDDFYYNNSRIDRLMSSAKSTLVAAVGYKKGQCAPKAFEELSNTYIVEYCRALIFGTDSSKLLLSIETQLEALLLGGKGEKS